MPLKRSSEVIQVSGTVENNTGAFSVNQIDLMLNPLDQEVFVILAVQVDFLGDNPLPLIAGPTPNTNLQVIQEVAFSSTRPTAQLTMGDSNTFHYASQKGMVTIGENGAGNATRTSYMLVEQSSDVPDTNLDYIHIIPTSDFFIGTTDDAQSAPGTNVDIAYRIWGYRAKADAATYAALVQSEVLSA